MNLQNALTRWASAVLLGCAMSWLTSVVVYSLMANVKRAGLNVHAPSNGRKIVFTDVVAVTLGNTPRLISLQQEPSDFVSMALMPSAVEVRKVPKKHDTVLNDREGRQADELQEFPPKNT